MYKAYQGIILLSNLFMAKKMNHDLYVGESTAQGILGMSCLE